MKLGKVIGGLLLVGIAVVAILVFVGLSNLDAIIKTAVESVGPQVTKTSVSLDQAKFELTQGRGELQGLVVGNPAGFSSDYALSMGRVAVEVDPASVTGPVIVIREILVDGARLMAEQKDLTHSNLQALLNNIKGGEAAQDAGGAGQESAGGDVRLMVEKFQFINSSAQVITEEWGDKTLNLPDIKLANIGDKQTGLTPDELAEAVLKPVIEQARRGVTKALESEAKAKAEAKLKEELSEKLSDEDSEKLDKLKSLFGR